MFFDEINTNELVGGFLKEILVNKKMDGELIDNFDRLIPMAAANPYKLIESNIDADSEGLNAEE